MGMERLRIFISSPGDVAEERVLANNLVRRLSDEFADRIWIEPVFWEHEPLLATDTFQKQIPPPHECEVAVCILWSRLGTRLPASITRPDGTPYGSGTEFEFEDAARGFHQCGRPQLLVYRKRAEPVVSLRDTKAAKERIRQKEALDQFIDKWFINEADGTIKAAYHSFVTTANFEKLLEEHLRKLIDRRLPDGEPPTAPPKLAWVSGSPFRGLDVFEFQHAPIFFGRTQAIGDVLNACRSNAAAGRGFLLVVGVSGGGKSSLLRAGVLPLLTQPGVIEGVALWRRATLKPSDAGGLLFKSLALALLQSSALPELGTDGTSPDQLAEMLRQAPASAYALIKGGLSQAAAATAREQALTVQPEAKLVIVVDQLEELFTLPNVTSEDRQSFVAICSALSRSGKVWVIATIRGDFYHRVFDLPELVALQEGSGQYALPLPATAEIAQMIRQPARAAGLSFEEDPKTKVSLDEVLREAAGASPESLPLLEFALEQLYQRRTRDGLLTYAAYDDLGGVEGALTHQAETLFNSLPPDVQAVLPRILRRMVRIGDRGSIARQHAYLDELDHIPQHRAFIEAFVKARLFSADRLDDRSVVRVTHEALLRVWPRVQRWLAEDREQLMVRSRVSAAAARWQAENQRTDLLLPAGKPLEEACSLLARWQDELSDVDRAFIARSSARGERVRWLKRSAVTALAGLTIAAMLFAAYAYHQRGVARSEQQRAASNLRFALKATDNLAVAVAREIQSNTQIPTKDKLFFANRLDSSLGDLRGAVGKTNALDALYSKLLTSNAFILLQSGHYGIAENSAERADKLLGSQTPVAEPLTPVDKTRTKLALALGHLYGMKVSSADKELEECDALLRLASPSEREAEASVVGARVLAARAELRFYQCRFDSAEDNEVAARGALTAVLNSPHPSALSSGMRQEVLATLADLQMLRTDLCRIGVKGRPTEILNSWRAMLDLKPALFDGDADPLARLLSAYTEVFEADAKNDAGQTGEAVLHASAAVNRLYELARDDPKNLKLKYLLCRALLVRANYALATQDLRQAELDLIASRTLVLSIKRDSNIPLLCLRLDLLIDLNLSALSLAQNNPQSAISASSQAVARVNLLRTHRGEVNFLNWLASRAYYSNAFAYLQAGDHRRAKESIRNSLQALEQAELKAGANTVFYSDQFSTGILTLYLNENEIGSDQWISAFNMARKNVDLILKTTSRKDRWLRSEASVFELNGIRSEEANLRDDADEWYRQAFAALFEVRAIHPDSLDAIADIVALSARRVASLMASGRWDDAIRISQTARQSIPADASLVSGSDDLLKQWTQLQTALTSKPADAKQPGQSEEAKIDRPERVEQEVAFVQEKTGAVEALCTAATKSAIAQRIGDAQTVDLQIVDESQIGNGWDGNVVKVRRRFGSLSEPLYPGAWRTLVGAEFEVAAEKFAKTVALQGTFGKAAIGLIRETPLPFYDGGELLEAEYTLPSGESYTTAILRIRDEIYELNGTSPPIHKANKEAPLKLATASDAAAYLRFFDSSIGGGKSSAEDPFQIVDRAELLPWEPNVSEAQRAGVSNVLRPLTVWPDPDGRGSWRATATVQKENQIFHAEFKIAGAGRDDNGMVEMSKDLTVAKNLALQPPRFTTHGRLSRPLQTVDLQGLGELSVTDEVNTLYDLSKSNLKSQPEHAADLAAEAAVLQLAIENPGREPDSSFRKTVKVLRNAVNQHVQTGSFTDAYREQDGIVQRWITLLSGVDTQHPRYQPSMVELTHDKIQLASLALLNGEADRANELAADALRYIPDEPRGQIELANAQLTLGHPDVAAGICRANAEKKIGDHSWIAVAEGELDRLHSAGSYVAEIDNFRRTYPMSGPPLTALELLEPFAEAERGPRAQSPESAKSGGSAGEPPLAFPSFSCELPGDLVGGPSKDSLFDRVDFLLGDGGSVIILVPAKLPAEELFLYVDWYRIALTTKDKVIGDLPYQGDSEVRDRLLSSVGDNVGLVDYVPGTKLPGVITAVAKICRGRPPDLR